MPFRLGSQTFVRPHHLPGNIATVVIRRLFAFQIPDRGQAHESRNFEIV